MVNTGKPSRGCYMCRARRIKCDEGKPSCMRCQKSKRICPGYRDAFELKLRDESKLMKKKLSRRDSSVPENVNDAYTAGLYNESFVGLAAAYSSSVMPPMAPRMFHSRSSSESSTSSQEFMGDSRSTALQVHRNHPFLTAHMTTPIHQQASCYFLANFVLIPEEGTMRGYFDYIIPLLKKDKPSPPLLHAFSAVALAAFGTRPNSKALLPKADLWYLEALKEITVALKDPNVASSDSTLAAVMLLASFEQLVPSRMMAGGWASHIDGAVAVIKSRPPNTWQGGVFRDIFLAVRAHMTIQCIANGKPADPSIDWLSVTASDEITESFAVMNLKMAQLRADNDKITSLTNHTTENLEKVLKLLRRAEALEREYIAWVENLPAAWAIKTIAWLDGDVENLETSVVHPGRVVAYGELWMAYYYNIVRTCRLYIWTTILRCVAWMSNPRDYRLSPEYTTASCACRQLIEDIIASVPYFFGWNRDKDAAMADKSNFACGINDNTSIKGLSGIFVMWPIFTAAASDFASPSQRLYLRGRLRYIAEQMGINQAAILLQAQLLHPSLYIARERVNLSVPTCSTSVVADTQLSFNEGTMKAVMNIARPTIDSQWIPRSFQEGDTEMTSDFMQDTTCNIMSQDFGGYNNYEHELASYAEV